MNILTTKYTKHTQNFSFFCVFRGEKRGFNPLSKCHLGQPQNIATYHKTTAFTAIRRDFA